MFEEITVGNVSVPCHAIRGSKEVCSIYEDRSEIRLIPLPFRENDVEKREHEVGERSQYALMIFRCFDARELRHGLRCGGVTVILGRSLARFLLFLGVLIFGQEFLVPWCLIVDLSEPVLLL